MATTDDVKDQLRQGLANAQDPDRKTIRQLLEDPKQQMEVAKALPNALSPERFTRLLLTAINSQPDLAQCDAFSLLAAGMQCAALGLEPNTALQHCWILPFKNNRAGRMDCQFILGYQGMIDLAMRSPRVLSVAAREVREHDEFDHDYGVADLLVHKTGIGKPRGDIVTYYALAHFSGGGHYWRIVEQDEIDRHRARSAAPNSPAWKNDELAMSLKTCVRIAWPWLPKTAEAALATAMDEQVARYDHWFGPDGKAIDVEARETMMNAESERQFTDPPAPAADDTPGPPCKDCKGENGQHTEGCPQAPFN